MKTRPNIQFLKSKPSYFIEDKENIEDLSDIMNSASTNSSNKKKKWRRKRKNTSQVQVLIDEYNRSPIWTKEQVVSLAQQTGLSEAQVYKWGWDYKKKLRKQASQYNISELLCSEIVGPSSIDLEMLDIQRSYKDAYSMLNSIIPTQLLF